MGRGQQQDFPAQALPSSFKAQLSSTKLRFCEANIPLPLGRLHPSEAQLCHISRDQRSDGPRKFPDHFRRTWIFKKE